MNVIFSEDNFRMCSFNQSRDPRKSLIVQASYGPGACMYVYVIFLTAGYMYLMQNKCS